MNEEHQHHSIVVQQVKNHRFAVMIGGSIVVALLLVYVALGLYASSGAAQLDLSRPGLEDIREQTAQDDGSYKGFDANGTLTEASYDEFEKLYSEKLEETESIDAFSGDPLSPKSLQIDHDSALRSTSTEQ